MTLNERFMEKTKDWKNKLNSDEWFFSKVREEIFLELETEEAFYLISEAVDLVLAEKDKFLCGEIFELLIDLIRFVNTTEMPKNLLSNWDKLVKLISALGNYYKNKIDELKVFYNQ